MASKEDTPAYIMDTSDEITRLSYNHALFKDAMGGNLVLAPIDFSSGPKRILDSATADGLWLRDLAATCPVDHEFTGTDINPAQFPKDSVANFSYRVQDVHGDWPVDWNSRFDLVHQRLGLAASGPRTQDVVKNMARLVRPGGWIQFVEADDHESSDAGPMWKQNMILFRDLFKAMGSRYSSGDEIAGWLRDVGFEDVEEKVFGLRFGALNPNEELARKGVISSRLGLQQLCAIAKTFPPGAISLSHEELDRLPVEGPLETEKQGHIMYMRAVWGRQRA
ncbi:S-adenosyl-L-methionine-dependent methyltransferase [Lophiotrema nucula]|uniref:S-adenosyl-L-methionine-dependent methyltransferase n=1 Tax=Lophiotrema nucula TaxID=690887 RepID=A0A6A5ZN30_9PLEO|nr:S-adenosyl-L-methionine-dependent methyltransferase [Lophiotrema nucula]